jgi:hypothetical protein
MPRPALAAVSVEARPPPTNAATARAAATTRIRNGTRLANIRNFPLPFCPRALVGTADPLTLLRPYADVTAKVIPKRCQVEDIASSGHNKTALGAPAQRAARRYGKVGAVPGPWPLWPRHRHLEWPSPGARLNPPADRTWTGNTDPNPTRTSAWLARVSAVKEKRKTR